MPSHVVAWARSCSFSCAACSSATTSPTMHRRTAAYKRAWCGRTVIGYKVACPYTGERLVVFWPANEKARRNSCVAVTATCTWSHRANCGVLGAECVAVFPHIAARRVERRKRDAAQPASSTVRKGVHGITTILGERALFDFFMTIHGRQSL